VLSRLLALIGLAALLAAAAPAAADTYTVTLDPSARRTPATGRVILFFITETGVWWARRPPARGPFFQPPQPLASIAVEDFRPGQSVTLDGTALAFPQSLDALDGPMRVQAALDTDRTERSHLEGPGNVLSDIVSVELRADRDDAVSLRLSEPIRPPRAVVRMSNLKWVEHRSALLSDFYGRRINHRAGVALPKDYYDPEALDRQWPVVFVIPGFGDREEGAVSYAEMLANKGVEEVAPIAVYVVLDPESPLGHHGFVDSANNGPRGTALVEEFIPYLEKKFRIVRRPEARLVTGHSSGGFSALWLQLRYPETFGGCWATAPDPIDFSAFQTCNLYEDENLYTDAEGNVRPCLREMVSAAGEMEVTLTVRQECTIEYVLDPDGASGQQWDAWEAMFSPRDPQTMLPRPMFDPRTGAIDRQVVNEWSAFDITRMVAADWARYGPIVTHHVRLTCGDRDSYYLERAVERFKRTVEELAESSGGSGGADGADGSGGSGGSGTSGGGPGYVRLVPYATHATLVPLIFQRQNEEIREHLRRHGLHD